MRYLIPLFIISLFIYVFFIEPNMLVVKKYKINDIDLKGLKIVLVGDFHIKKTQEKRLHKIVELINEQNPDIVLSVGDFVSGHNEKSTMPLENILKQLNKINSKYGFYTVLGNHDWWVYRENVSKLFDKNNIKLLKNSNICIKLNEKTLSIAGIEDLQTGNPDIKKALVGTEHPIILLTHSPDIFPEVPDDINLTLAGHVHGGQIRIPFLGAIIIPSKYSNRYSQGLIIENHKKMIVTKGIGTSILPVRFNCIPEIVVIEFY